VEKRERKREVLLRGTINALRRWETSTVRGGGDPIFIAGKVTRGLSSGDTEVTSYSLVEGKRGGLFLGGGYFYPCRNPGFVTRGKGGGGEKVPTFRGKDQQQTEE